MVLAVVLGTAAFLFPQRTCASTTLVFFADDFATAKQMFWLRAAAWSDAAKKSIVLTGTTLELVDSAVGDPMQEGIPHSAT